MTSILSSANSSPGAPTEPAKPLEQAWTEMWRAARWAERFELFFVFGEAPALNELAQRLGEALRARVAPLVRIDLREEPEAELRLVADVLAIPERERKLRAPLWLGLGAAAPSLERDARIRAALLRLNERRELLRSTISGVVVIALPPGWRPFVREIAADLWHIRALSVSVAAATPEGGAGRVEEPRVQFARRRDDSAVAKKLAEELKAPLNPRTTVLAGAELVRRAIAEGLLNEASDYAQRLLALVRERASGDGSASRDLSIAVEALGDVAVARRQWDTAARTYAESLEIRRQLRERVGDSPEALRDVSVSLNRVGDVARAQGRLEAAQAAYAESLEISRQLREWVGDSPEALRDVSVLLDRVGDVARAQGRLEAAQAAYAESLEISRQLREWVGDSPEALRDVSVSLNKVGDVARAQRRLEAAQAAYAESLEISQRLFDVLGPLPETENDLKIVRQRLADLAKERGAAEQPSA